MAYRQNYLELKPKPQPTFSLTFNNFSIVVSNPMATTVSLSHYKFIVPSCSNSEIYIFPECYISKGYEATVGLLRVTNTFIYIP